ncbi:imidazole glycerol phosphate synthase subunit HisH [Hyphomonas sp. FCG-A18]|uniref:imidazole glycerol phosphate synthase subunit HisH n=1 Tax=Hyphomonas sp. FCG-A18 TaxID=3080019 RepID=UPI002B2B7FE3|nr:imidazole glycerol phosphate synthase subunit HisH [Hyphomonas sp. FCG-A18]
MKTIALIDYDSGNLHSAARALRVAANEAKKTREIQITRDPDTIAYADRIVLPGVGHFADCAANLRKHDGLIEALEEAILKRGVPFFGICVGQQLLATRGLEDGETPGLNWIPGTVDLIKPGADYRVPHMGWNELTLTQDHPVLAGLGAEPHVYFTHSYAYTQIDEAHIAARTHYGTPLVAAVARDNLFATQFHPEKSQKTGLKILSNFVLWQP